MAVHPQSIALATPPPQSRSVTKTIAANTNNSNSKPIRPAKRVGSGLRRSQSNDSIFSTVTLLPADVQQLKDKILETHPEKLTRFSLSHMRRIAIPPVEIPKSLKSRSAVSTVVSGKSVPLTKQMWENRKKRTHHLDMIDEYVLYQ